MEATANIEKQIESALREDNAELLKPFLKSKDRQDLLIDYREPITGGPLMALAIEQGRLKIVRLLLTILDVNVTWWNNVTPLMMAAKNDRLEIVKLLLEKGANVKANDSTVGLSALHFACRNGHEGIVKVLYRYGASIFNGQQTSKCVNNETFKKVLTDGKRNIMHTIVDCERNKEKVCREVLFAAIQCNNIEFVKLMLDRGVNIEATFTGDGETTPLMSAVRKRQPSAEIVKLLLDGGADVTRRYYQELTVLHYAAEYNLIDIMQLLLEYGADINATADYNETPLHKAMWNTHKEATKFLLSMGADVNIERTLNNLMNVMFQFDEVIYPKPVEVGRGKKQLELSKIVLMHIVQLQSKGIIVNENIVKNVISKDKVALKAFQLQCENELDRIKAEKKFPDSYFSLYDVFKAKEVLQLAAYAKNREMAVYFTSEEFRKDFPIYSETILENFGKGVERNYLQARVCNFFANLFTRKENKLPKLPVLCASEVFSYLSDRDLINLRKAYY